MPLLTLCHVVRTSGLLGPERVAQALKIILTLGEQKETRHASRAVCPRVDEPARENGYYRESIGGAPRVRGRARLYSVSGTYLSGQWGQWQPARPPRPRPFAGPSSPGRV
jgi:hypothetical protein